MKENKVWEVLLKQHDELVGRANTTLYDRVTLLKRVYEDTHYLGAMEAKKLSAVGVLSSKVSDTCCDILELFQMLRMFPTREEWEKNGIADLKARMVSSVNEAQAKAKQRRAKDKKKKGSDHRRTATLAEVQDMKRDIKSSGTEIAHLKQQLTEKDRTIKSLETALESARETIGSLNETISLFKLDRERASA